MQGPSIIVFESRLVAGVDSLAAPKSTVTPHPLAQVRDAMGTMHNSDAHFVQYVTLADGEVCRDQFRINKSVLSQLVARGASVALFVFAVDIDNPKHGAWSKELIEQFEAAVARVPTNLKPTWIYRTRGGARFVYHLATPVVAQEAEARHRGLVKVLANGAFANSPFTVDPKCSDWTRLFRLPMVMRDGRSTVEEWFFTVEHDATAQPLDWRTLESVAGGPADRLDVAGVPDPSVEPAPTPEEARLLLHAADNTETDFFRLLRANVAGMRCENAVLKCELPPEGARDGSMLSFVGELCARVYGPPLNGSPEHVYAALLPVAEQLRPDAEHPDWAKWLWSKIGYSWRNVAKRSGPILPSNSQPHPALDAAPPTQDGEHPLTALARRVRLWYPTPALDVPDSEEAQFLVKKLSAVCVGNKHYHVLRPNGYFDPTGVTIEHLGNELIRHGWENSFTLYTTDKEGREHPVATNDVLKQIMVRHISRVEGHVSHPGDTVRALETDRPVYDMALYRLRTDLEPAWSDEVDELMVAQAGEHQIDAYRKWIAYALDFSEPICMLALRGTNGIGKSFMGLGLADCLAAPAPVLDGGTLMSGFPEDLLHTPFVEIAEALPVVGGASNKARDRLRQMIGGAAIPVNRKNRSVVWAHTMLRILITMNNDETIRQLADDEASVDDVKAIMQRTLVLQLQEGAADWLRERGGKAYTRSWVSNGGSQQTDYKLARHFLFLHSVREQWQRGSRLLVEGEGYGKGLSDTADTLMSSDAFLEVAQAICEMLNQHEKGNLEGISLSDRDVAVTTFGIEAWLTRPGRRTNLSPRSIGLQLRNVSALHPTNTTRTATTGKSVKARWWVLDLGRLLHLAQTYGWPHDFLAARVGQIGV